MLHTPPIFILLFSLIFFSSLALNSIPPTMYLTYLSYCLSLPGECLFSKGRDFSLLCLLVYAWYLEGSPMQKRNLVSFSEQMAGREGGEEEYSSAPALRSVSSVAPYMKQQAAQSRMGACSLSWRPSQVLLPACPMLRAEGPWTPLSARPQPPPYHV